MLAHVLSDAKMDQEAFVRAAQDRHPDSFWLNFTLAKLLAKKEPAEASRYFQAALALRPKSTAVLDAMGTLLSNQKRWKQGIACYRRALAARSSRRSW